MATKCVYINLKAFLTGFNKEIITQNFRNISFHFERKKKYNLYSRKICGFFSQIIVLIAISGASIWGRQYSEKTALRLYGRDFFLLVQCRGGGVKEENKLTKTVKSEPVLVTVFTPLPPPGFRIRFRFSKFSGSQSPDPGEKRVQKGLYKFFLLVENKKF